MWAPSVKTPVWTDKWKEASRGLLGVVENGQRPGRPAALGRGWGKKKNGCLVCRGALKSHPWGPAGGGAGRGLGTGEAEPRRASRKKRPGAGSLPVNRWSSRCRRRKQRKGASLAPRCVRPQLLKRPNKAGPLLWQLPWKGLVPTHLPPAPIPH